MIEGALFGWRDTRPGDPVGSHRSKGELVGWTGRPCDGCDGTGEDREGPHMDCGGTGEEYGPIPEPMEKRRTVAASVGEVAP